MTLLVGNRQNNICYSDFGQVAAAVPQVWSIELINVIALCGFHTVNCQSLVELSIFLLKRSANYVFEPFRSCDGFVFYPNYLILQELFISAFS